MAVSGANFGLANHVAVVILVGRRSVKPFKLIWLGIVLACALLIGALAIPLLTILAPGPVARINQAVALQLNLLDGKRIVSNEFEFSLTRLKHISTERGFNIIPGRNGNDFEAVGPGALQFGGYDIRGFLETTGLVPATDLKGGIKKILQVKGRAFALMGLGEKDCVFGALLDLEAQSLVDRFPCLPDPAEELSFNGLGGGHAVRQDRLYLAVGAPSDNPDETASQLAQSADSPYGKILSYEIVADSSGIKLENRSVFSSGHRNPQGMSLLEGKLVAVEHGPKGGDEINIISEGRNYGWPQYSLGSAYDDTDVRSFSSDMAMNTDPLFAFTPSIGISDVSVCPSTIAQRYEGIDCLLIASLIGQSLFIVLADLDAQRVISAERVQIGARIRQLIVRNDVLYIGTDYFGMYRIEIDAL